MQNGRSLWAVVGSASAYLACRLLMPSELCSPHCHCGFQKHRAGTEENTCENSGEFPYSICLTNSLGNILSSVQRQVFTQLLQ